jgi:hypothetical protein
LLFLEFRDYFEFFYVIGVHEPLLELLNI